MALQEVTQPKVFIGIATGPSKWYAAHYMVAALRNLDWGNMEIHWAVTDFGDSASTVYLQRLKALMATVEWKGDVFIHTTKYDVRRAPVCVRQVAGETSSYDFVIKNLRLLRGEFLDGDCDLFLEVGGDNPPPRDTVKRLLKFNVDVAFGTCYQRPNRDGDHECYPLVWQYTWNLKDLEQYNLEPIVKEKLKLAYTCTPFVVPIYANKRWKQMRYLKPYAGGTGMVLIKRHVLEKVGWRLPPSLYFSEDLYFCHQCNAHGFSTVGDLRFHVPHLDESGRTF
jgi:hypothetical protein